ncbi:unnamed protein product [Arabidopsis arenosa]|uniref:BED-type domain-containing protein n=1 Tax=Arabidopsis arenosa TaxID=38785 RepID=A0A8S2ARD3_ARAAE|nr:unnamed protein product [Arabidopsis arenosa]
MVSSQNQAENEDVRLEESDSETEEETPCSNSRTGKKRKRNPGASEASSPIPVKKIQTRSGVWEHFTRFVKDENKCKCHYCGSVMSCKTTSGTSNLQGHLTKACKQYKVWVSDKGKQQAITPDGHLKLAKVSEAVVREATNELMVMAELPLSFVEYATDWVAIDRLVQFLHIFHHSTLVVSASSSLNAHKCYSEICTIEKNLIRLSNSPDLGMQTKAKNMRDKFDKYWEGVKEINRLLIIASVFDPTKKMQFAQHSFDKLYGKDSVVGKQIHASVTSVMKSLFDAYNININGPQVQSQATSSSHSHAQSQNQSGQESDINEMDSEVVKGYERMDFEYNDMVQQKGTHDASNELELYLMEPVENPNLMLGTEYDVLGYWRLNSPKFPILSAIARDVLAMQVSSVASESAFSTSGRILDPYRSCLTHSTLEVLMCTEQWLKCTIHLNDKGLFTISDVLGGDVDVQDKLQKGREEWKINSRT